MSELTLILLGLGSKAEGVMEKLLPLVYEELRLLAAARMARESAGHTLQPTAARALSPARPRANATPQASLTFLTTPPRR